MKKKTLLYILSAVCSCLFAAISIAQTPTIQWQHALGGSDDDEPRSIEQTTDGGFIVAGFTKSTDGDVTGLHGTSDYWIVKLNSAGDIMWQKTLGGTGGDLARDVEQTSDGGYIVAGYSSSDNGDVPGNYGNFDYWIVKLDALGNISWSRNYGGSKYDNAYAVQQTEDHGYLVAGYTYSSDIQVTGYHGNEDYWIIKLDSIGNLQWEKAMGGSQFEEPSAIEKTPDGNYIIAGYSNSNDGDVSGNLGSFDVWLTKIDVNGNLLWQKMYGGSLEDASRDVVVTPDGGFAVAGYSYSHDKMVDHNYGNADYWVIKIDANGNKIWENNYGGPKFEIGYSIAYTNDHGYIICGFTDSNDGEVLGNHGLTDCWLIKIDSIGNLVWQRPLGGSLDDLARDAIQTTDGRYVMAAFPSSSDGDVIGNHGFYDVWIVKMCDNPSDFYADTDGDSYGNPNTVLNACTAPAGYVVNASDCNDQNSNIHPNAIDICNTIDDNCNGQIDENAITATISPPGPITICQPSTVLLTATQGNYTYQWTRNGNNMAGATSSTLVCSIGGTYVVNISNGICSAASASVSATAKPSPMAVINPSGTVKECSGVEVTLTANAGNNLTYQWFKGNNAISNATGQTYIVAGAAKGTFTVKVSSPFGCSTTSAETIIKRYTSPTASISVLNNGNLDLCFGQVKLKSNTATQWQWLLNTLPIAGATNQNYKPLSAGSYSVQVSNQYNCSAVSAAVSVLKTCRQSAEDSFINPEMIIAPNPAKDNLHVTLTMHESVNAAARIIVTNVLGGVVFSRDFFMEDGNLSENISLPNEAGGIHFVKISVGEKVFVEKMIIEK